MPNCKLCGEPMPAGEEMFKYHGYSGPCPKPTTRPVDPGRLVPHHGSGPDRMVEDRQMVDDARLDRAEIKRLRHSLEESVKLQSHYAGLLNAYDGGKRMQFIDSDAWITRLREAAR